MRRFVLGRRVASIGLLLLLATSLFFLGNFLATKGIAWAGNFGSIAAFFLAFVAFVMPVFTRWWNTPQPVSMVDATQAADDLAVSLSQQLADEDKTRRVHDPRPLPVRWEVTPIAEAKMRGASLGNQDDAAGSLSTILAGKFDEILQVFSRVPSRRLVILGRAGAGKSVLVTKLARELLTSRTSGGPVPVILPAATWDPTNSLSDWIAAQLTVSHPGLSVRIKLATGNTANLAQMLASRN